VLRAVAAHYDTTNTTPAKPASGYDVLKDAAALLVSAGSFAVVSPESLAYVYEHTLVTKDCARSSASTPRRPGSWTTWSGSLYDWVRRFPSKTATSSSQPVGHAPFLLSMMRLLRMEMHGKTDKAVHAYLKDPHPWSGDRRLRPGDCPALAHVGGHS